MSGFITKIIKEKSSKIHKKSVRRAAALLLSGALLFTGCGTDAENSAYIDNDSEDTSFTLLTEVTEGGSDIYIIGKSSLSNYWKKLLKGARRAAREEAANLYYASSDGGDNSYRIQAELLETAVDQGADAIILIPADSDSMSEYVKYYHGEGIPIVILDTIVNTSDFDVCYMTDNTKAGQLAAEKMISLLQQQGLDESSSLTVALSASSTASQTSDDRISGFIGYWMRNAPSSWALADDVKVNDGSYKKAETNVDELLVEYPDLKGIFANTNTTTVGCVRALNSSERKDISLVGFDWSDEMSDVVENNVFPAASIVQKQYEMGYRGVESAVSMIGGQYPEQKYFDTDVMIIDNSNYNSSEAQMILHTD